MLIEQRIQQGIPLREHTSFEIGGSAKYFFEAKSKEEIIEAIKWAKQNDLPFFVFGGGSNLLVSDNGYKGLVIKTLNNKYSISDTTITAEAGVEMEALVKFSVEHSLSGLEWANGLPGVVGGAVYGNASAFGQSIGDIIKQVKVLELFDSSSEWSSTFTKIVEYSHRHCHFSPKHSIFKRNKKLIILSAVFQLKRRYEKQIKEEMETFLKIRQERHHFDFPSAGCAFQNPTSEESAAELIEKCGLKGKQIGEAQISKNHANFIVNLGNAKSIDVLSLIRLAQDEVKKQFNIDLKQEIQYLK